jgi:hypothetical protein
LFSKRWYKLRPVFVPDLFRVKPIFFIRFGENFGLY